MRTLFTKLLLTLTAVSSVFGIALTPKTSSACWFGCFGCCGGHYSARAWTPYRAGYAARTIWGDPVYVSDGCSTCSGGANYSGCGTCSDGCSVANSPSAGSGSNSGTNGSRPETDKWRPRQSPETYDSEDNSSRGAGGAGGTGGASGTGGTSSSDDAIRGGGSSAGAGGSAGNDTSGSGTDGESGSSTEGGANGRRGGLAEDDNVESRTALRPESPAADEDKNGERVKIEPRNKKAPPSAAEEQGDKSETKGSSDKSESKDAGESKSGRLSLPQASRLDGVIARSELSSRERTVARKAPVKTGRLVRVADYSTSPWSDESVPATVARSR